MDRIALSVRGNILVPILFTMIQTMIVSENWKERHASLMAISVVGEGCIKVLTPLLDKVMQLIFPLFRDPHERVRYSACHSVGQLATDFGPLFQIRYYHQVLQSLIMVMDDIKNPRVQSHAAAAIINFCDHCDKMIIEPYLHSLLSKLAQLLKQENIIVLEQAITAVAAVADCVMDKFIPYYDDFIPYFKSILINATGEAFSKLRGKAMEAISLIAVAVGKDKFSPDAKEVLDAMLAIQCLFFNNIQSLINLLTDLFFLVPLAPDDVQIPFLQQAWARLCKAIGKDFVPYLSALVPPLLNSASLPADVQLIHGLYSLSSCPHYYFIIIIYIHLRLHSLVNLTILLFMFRCSR